MDELAESNKRTCRVCNRPISQGRGKSKEHVIPNWMQKHFALGKRKISYTPLESLDIPISMQLTEPTPHPRRHHNFGSLLVGTVCKSCNDGWMSDIETAAKKDLIGLIEGSRCVAQSVSIARWAVKTAYTFTIATDPPIGRVPQHHMLALKTEKGIPEGVRVFARQDHDAEWWFSSATTYQILKYKPVPASFSGLVERHTRNSYRYFLRLGRLTLLVQFWPSLVDAVEYNTDLLSMVYTNGNCEPFTEKLPEFPEPGLNYDLAIRGTRCWLSCERRPLGDLCACGSGLNALICTYRGHPFSPAGNWGWNQFKAY